MRIYMSTFQVKNTLALAIRAVLLGVPAFTCGLTATVTYAATMHSLSIQKSTLDQALKQLAIQTGTTISYDSKTLSKIYSQGLTGSY